VTNTPSPEVAATLLDEVEKRRHDIRRRLGNGWFELAVFGSALLALALIGLVAKAWGTAQGAAGALVFAMAYLVVGAHHVRLRRQFGVGFDAFLGLLFSVVIFFGCSLAAWNLDGSAQAVAIALIPTIGVLAMMLIWRQAWMLGLAAVMFMGGLAPLLPGANDWASAVVYGGGFLVLAVLLARRFDGDRHGTA
jgi:hypothetical protein